VQSATDRSEGALAGRNKGDGNTKNNHGILMKMPVMVARCDDALRVTVRQYLERTGFEVETVHDGLKGLHKLEDNPPDNLVLEPGLLWGAADGAVACKHAEANVSKGNANSIRSGPSETAMITAIACRLRTSAYATAMDEVWYETEAGAVILQGRVSSLFFKQIAQEVVRKADAACRIVNQLEVEDRNRSATNGQANGKIHVP
jgi:CheY-like chemotaxis protein